MTRILDDPAAPVGGRSPGDWYAGPVPERHAGGGFVLARLTAAHAERDHAALMASVAYLRRWSDSDWPADDFSVAENREELGWHDEEHEPASPSRTARSTRPNGACSAACTCDLSAPCC